ncbi:hypothetical protein LQK80_33580 [Bacillus thuringiensis]|nr:hypothetical protein [Bacillus thuringiensis]
MQKQLNNIIEENNILNEEYTEIIDSLIEQKLSLRDLSRYFNLVKFYLPFLKEEVNVKDLLYLILIQVSSPELYQYIYTNKLLFINNYKFELDDEFKALPRLNEYQGYYAQFSLMQHVYLEVHLKEKWQIKRMGKGKEGLLRQVF